LPVGGFPPPGPAAGGGGGGGLGQKAPPGHFPAAGPIRIGIKPPLPMQGAVIACQPKGGGLKRLKLSNKGRLMASLALWAIRIGKRLPLPRRAQRQLDLCTTVELFESVFDKSVARPTLWHVLGLLPLSLLSPGVQNTTPEWAGYSASKADDIRGNSLGVSRIVLITSSSSDDL
jgi:hypothetical protein